MRHSLSNWTLINTRPLSLTESFNNEFECHGGRIISMPSLCIEGLPTTWVNELNNYLECDFLIFISRSAVAYSIDPLKKLKKPLISKAQILAIGKATEKELLENGVRVDLTPRLPNTENLLNLSELSNISNKKIIIFRGIGGRTKLYDTLKNRGADVITVDVYKRLKNNAFKHSWHDLRQANAILLTSVEGMINAIDNLKQYDNDWLFSLNCIVFGQRLADAATKLGMKKIIILNDNDVLKALLEKGQSNGYKIQEN